MDNTAAVEGSYGWTMARLLKVEVVLAFVENQVKNTKKKLEARGGLLAPVATSSSTPQPATWRCGMTTKVNVTALEGCH